MPPTRDLVIVPRVSALALEWIPVGGPIMLAKRANGEIVARRPRDLPAIAIADPFIESGTIKEGDTFDAWLKPGSVQWTHCGLDGESK